MNMPKNNIISITAFTDLLKSYNEFIKKDEELNIDDYTLNKHKRDYMLKVNEINNDLSELERIEKLLIQLRCKELISKEIRLTVLRDYIYARTIFYRPDKETNEIRVIVGKTNILGSDIDKLYRDVEFMKLCMDKLIESMNIEITNTIKELTEFRKNKLTETILNY